MNTLSTITENKADFLLSKIRLLLFKMLTPTDNKSERIIKFFNFCSNFISLVKIEQEI